jgi:CDP-4-dehydro-6-deoxyglucose reductase, E1
MTSDSGPAGRLRGQILELVREYHAEAFPPRAFEPGSTPVPVAGRVFDAEEIVSLVDCSLDFWLTTGRFARTFERRFARELFDRRHTILVNSGSSANVLAVCALTSPKLGARRLLPGTP